MAQAGPHDNGSEAGVSLVRLVGALRERDLRRRTLEALETAAELLHNGAYCDGEDDDEALRTSTGSKERIRSSMFEEPGVAFGAAARCDRMEIGTDAFADLQELYACVSLGYSWEDFVHSALATQTATASPTFVELAMESDDLCARESHLICHASEGFFLPVQDAGAPQFDASGRAPGGWVGSSVQLLAELASLCSVLDISLRPLRGAVRRGGGYDISVEALAELQACTARLYASSTSEQTRASDPASRLRDSVSHAWFVLFEGARLSQETGSALVLYAPGST